MEYRQFFVYMMTNKTNRVLYTGITNNLIRRVHEHKNGLFKGFTKKYNADKVVYFEVFDDPENAIRREKQIKAGSRQKKIDLINGFNPDWQDMTDKL